MSELRKKQTRIESAIEAVLNIGSGFVLSVLTWMFLVPESWMTPSATDAVRVTIIFTCVSLLRNYLWRRIFENELHKYIHKIVISLFRR